MHTPESAYVLPAYHMEALVGQPENDSEDERAALDSRRDLLEAGENELDFQLDHEEDCDEGEDANDEEFVQEESEA